MQTRLIAGDTYHGRATARNEGHFRRKQNASSHQLAGRSAGPASLGVRSCTSVRRSCLLDVSAIPRCFTCTIVVHPQASSWLQASASVFDLQRPGTHRPSSAQRVQGDVIGAVCRHNTWSSCCSSIRPGTLRSCPSDPLRDAVKEPQHRTKSLSPSNKDCQGSALLSRSPTRADPCHHVQL